MVNNSLLHHNDGSRSQIRPILHTSVNRIRFGIEGNVMSTCRNIIKKICEAGGAISTSTLYKNGLRFSTGAIYLKIKLSPGGAGSYKRTKSIGSKVCGDHQSRVGRHRNSER